MKKERMKEYYKTLRSEHGHVIVLSFLLLLSLVSLGVLAHISFSQKLSVAFLDVGQGDAILIRTPHGHEVLIDGGSSNAVLSDLESKMNFFDRSIDLVIATHDDTDHVTGLIPVLAKYDVEHIIRSPVRGGTELAHELSLRMDEEPAVLEAGEKGEVVDFGDGAKLYVLYPAKSISPNADTNDASVSVVLTYGDHSFLLTGDLPTKYESKLLSPHVPHHVTVFKAGHHGSKTSSGEALLSYIKPEYAIISAGKDNRYGHPNGETLERLKTYAKEALSTIDRGTITFESDGKMMMVETEK